MLLKFDQHLKSDENSVMASKTHAGMAYFAGTGPVGKTCRECAEWLGGEYKKSDRQLKLAACLRGTGKTFPHTAPACKYFEQSPNPPAPILKEAVA